MLGESPLSFLEFFAGGGLARVGLGEAWRCVFANDWDGMKARAYRRAFGGQDLVEGDVSRLEPDQLPTADLAWASFPCQDLSLAGPREGLAGARSGVFFAFWKLIEALDAAKRGPPLIMLENVRGLASARGGRDLATVITTLSGSGRFIGVLELDARWFTPQSRPRLFVLASRAAPKWARSDAPLPYLHPPALQRLAAALPPAALARWVWWRTPPPPARNARLADILDGPETPDLAWHSPEQTARLLAMLSPSSAAELERLRGREQRAVGAYFRRMRQDGGLPVQRVEARFDGLAGCLRTPRGGSSRQGLLFAEGAETRSRLLRAREAARLMGLPEDYPLPERESDALALLGDGVAPPVVAWLSRHLLQPLALSRQPAASAA